MKLKLKKFKALNNNQIGFRVGMNSPSDNDIKYVSANAGINHYKHLGSHTFRGLIEFESIIRGRKYDLQLVGDFTLNVFGKWATIFKPTRIDVGADFSRSRQVTYTEGHGVSTERSNSVEKSLEAGFARGFFNISGGLKVTDTTSRTYSINREWAHSVTDTFSFSTDGQPANDKWDFYGTVLQKKMKFHFFANNASVDYESKVEREEIDMLKELDRLDIIDIRNGGRNAQVNFSIKDRTDVKEYRTYRA